MNKLMTAAAMVGVGMAACADQSQNTNEVTDIPPVTIYASRIDDAKDDMPSAVTVFTARDIESSGVRDLPELLRKKAGLDVHSMHGNPLLTSVAMRGFGDNAFGRTKIVLDGEELNNVDMAAPNLARVPMGSVERVEVIHGPSPVLYGDGAVAGVINVTTDTRDYEKRTKIAGRAGSQRTYGGNVQTKGGFEEEGVQYSASYDYLQSDGYRRRSAYDIHTASAGVRKNFENGSTIGLKAGYQNAFYELPGALSYSEWKHARKSANDRDNWNRTWSYAVSLDSKLRIAEDQWLYVDGGFSRQYRNANWGQWGYDNDYSLYSFFISPRYVNEMDVAGFGNKFTAGLDFRHDYDGITDRSGYNPPKYHFNRDRFAGFLHDEFFLMEELSIVAGARLECIDNRWSGMGPWTGTGGMRDPKVRDWKSDYELGLVYRPVDGLKTYVRGTRFHRSAFCDEMNYSVDGRPIDPETGASLDVGAEWRFLEDFSFDVNGYGMVMEDEIFLSPNPLASRNCNSPAKTRRIGLDTGFSWKREKVAEASIRYGLVKADFGSGEYHGCDVPYVPNHRIRVEGGFWLFGEIEIKVGYSFVGSQYLSGDYLNEGDKLPAYSLFDAGVHYEPSWAKGWKASFVIDNLFDRNYCDYALYSAWGNSYYPACGRSFMFALSYEF